MTEGLKTLPYDALLAMDEATICEVFPLGAVEWKGRWRPAQDGQKADRELAKLLKDKKSCIEKPRFLSARYSRSNYTDVAALGMKREPQAVDKETQDRFSEEGRQFQPEERPMWERLRDLEKQARPQQLASLRKRLESVERAVHDKAA